MKPIYYNDEDEEIEIPTRWEICDTCRGGGTHVNPSIDGNGLSREDFDEDPDFREDYLSGIYDVICEECDGSGKVRVPDYECLTPEQQRAVDRYEEYSRELAWEENLRRRGIEY